MAEAATGALRRTLNLRRPDEVYNAIIDAHRDLDDDQCRAFDAGLILLLANHVGDADVIAEALACGLREKYGVAKVIIPRKPYFSKPAPAELLEQMANEVDVAIAAVGG